MKLHVILRFAIIALFVICFVKRAGGPALADEIDFILPMHKWVADGPQRIGVFHAPFYPWVESYLASFFSVKTGVLRLIGLVTTLLASGFLVAAALIVHPLLAPWRLTILLALALLAPYTLGSALILDHDPTVLLAATALYFFLMALHDRPSRDHQGRLVLTFGLALGLCLMGKESTALVYPAGLVLLFWPTFGFARALLLAALSGVLGCMFFLAVTSLWCSYYAIPLSTVFEMDLLGLTLMGGHPQPWNVLSFGASVWVKVVPMLWLGLPLSLLFLKRIPLIFRAGGAARAIALNVLLVLFTYTFLLRQTTYNFPKYMSPILLWIPWLVLVPDRESTGHSNLTSENFRSWAFVILLWFILVPLDPMWVLHDRTPHSLWLALAVFTVPTAVWVAVRYLNLTSWSNGSPRFSTMSLLFSVGLALIYCRTALISNASITYWYGDTSIAEAVTQVQDWRAKNPTGKIFVPSKDIAYSTREFGTIYISKDSLGADATTLCADKKPLLVVTRMREDTSLSRAAEYDVLRKCLGPIVQGVDIAFASAYSQN